MVAIGVDAPSILLVQRQGYRLVKTLVRGLQASVFGPGDQQTRLTFERQAKVLAAKR
jgi:hypothetical protein